MRPNLWIVLCLLISFWGIRSFSQEDHSISKDPQLNSFNDETTMEGDIPSICDEVRLASGSRSDNRLQNSTKSPSEIQSRTSSESSSSQVVE